MTKLKNVTQNNQNPLKLVINAIEKIDQETISSVVINGSAEWTVPLTVNDIVVNGLLRCPYGISAKVFRCMGTAKLEKEVNIKKLYCDGSVSIMNHTLLEFTSIFCSGVVKCRSHLQAEKMHINGTVNVTEGTLSAGALHCSGTIICGGELKADSIKSTGYLFAEKITAQNIEMDYNPQIAQKFLKKNIKLTNIIPEISGEKIILENINAYLVNGKDITIKSGCSIDTVQYSENIHIEEGAEVGTCRKIDPSVPTEA